MFNTVAKIAVVYIVLVGFRDGMVCVGVISACIISVTML